jgi:hypothetical protein
MMRTSRQADRCGRHRAASDVRSVRSDGDVSHGRLSRSADRWKRTAPRPAHARRPLASSRASGRPHPTFSTRSVPAASRAGATRAACPPGLNGDPRSAPTASRAVGPCRADPRASRRDRPVLPLRAVDSFVSRHIWLVRTLGVTTLRDALLSGGYHLVGQRSGRPADRSGYDNRSGRG